MYKVKLKKEVKFLLDLPVMIENLEDIIRKDLPYRKWEDCLNKKKKKAHETRHLELKDRV